MLRWSNFALRPAKSHEMGQYGHKGNTAAFHNATVSLLHYENSVSKQRYEKPGMIPGQVVTDIFRCLCVYRLGNRRIIPEIPYLCRVFLPRIAIHGILTAAPGSPGAVFYCRLY